MGEMVLRNACWPALDALDCVPLQWRVRYDKTTDAISDRSAHKYGGYLTPLLPIAAASPDCQPRPLATPQKPTLLFPATNPPFKIQKGFHGNHPPKPTLLFLATYPPFKIQMGFHANHPPKPTPTFPSPPLSFKIYRWRCIQDTNKQKNKNKIKACQNFTVDLNRFSSPDILNS